MVRSERFHPTRYFAGGVTLPTGLTSFASLLLTSGDVVGFAGDAAGEAIGDAIGLAVAATVAVGVGVAGLFGVVFTEGWHAPKTVMLAAKTVEIIIDLLMIFSLPSLTRGGQRRGTQIAVRWHFTSSRMSKRRLSAGSDWPVANRSRHRNDNTAREERGTRCVLALCF
jgi:hypothetical protein